MENLLRGNRADDLLRATCAENLLGELAQRHSRQQLAQSNLHRELAWRTCSEELAPTTCSDAQLRGERARIARGTCCRRQCFRATHLLVFSLDDDPHLYFLPVPPLLLLLALLPSCFALLPPQKAVERRFAPQGSEISRPLTSNLLHQRIVSLHQSPFLLFQFRVEILSLIVE